MKHLTNASKNDEWYTPLEYIEAARLVLGAIDLDPASSNLANAVVKAGRFYTQEQDGLLQPWAGRVWLNPPYSRGKMRAFVERLLASYGQGEVSAAVLVANNATETRWFQKAAQSAAAMCYPSRRIFFYAPPDAYKGTAPLQGQVFFYFGPEPRAFKKHFRRFGLVTLIEPDSVSECARCGTNFRHERKTARYCSVRCRVADHREKRAA